jgi:hypothetical protein
MGKNSRYVRRIHPLKLDLSAFDDCLCNERRPMDSPIIRARWWPRTQLDLCSSSQNTFEMISPQDMYRSAVRTILYSPEEIRIVGGRDSDEC